MKKNLILGLRGKALGITRQARGFWSTLGPHQGAREIARRREQIKKGILNGSNGLIRTKDK